MQDEPRPSEIVGAVAAFLRGAATKESGPHIAFQLRVAGNALEIAQRQLDLAPVAEAEELARLKALLGRDGTLADLNAALALAIRAGDMDLSTPGLADHLWATTMAKLAVDQPNYSGYRAALAERGAKTE
jgi:hypothetical protein